MPDTETEVVVDLTRPIPTVTADRDRVVAWLRNSGGTLNDRLMKHAAADMIEELTN